MAPAAPKKKYYLAPAGARRPWPRRLTEGTGKIQINGRALDSYFTEDKDRNAVIGPLKLAEMRNRLDVIDQRPRRRHHRPGRRDLPGHGPGAQDDVRPHSRA